jgi:hypothetical protein
MPQNGDINMKADIGIFKNVCCNSEIVLSEGMTFPDCPNHPNLTTIWKEIHDQPIPRAADLNKKRSA